jgi:uncharacterized membrane protein
MFEFLFKYPFAAFQRGEFVLLGSGPRWLLTVLILVSVAGLGLLVRARWARSAESLRNWRLGVLWALESLTVVTLWVLLWRPALAITELKPRQNIVAILVDDSRSMGLSDSGPQSSSREQQAVSALRSGLLPPLQQKFQTRLYRLDTGVTRVNSADELGEATGAATHLGASLDQLTTETADLPLGAVVLLSDGGDNAGGVDRSVIESLRNRRIPVYTVGFGPETATQDAEMEDVVIATRTLAGSRLNATVKFQQHGFRGRQSTLTVRDGTKVLTSKAITFASDGEVQTQELLFNVGAAGGRALQFALEPMPGEINRANNTLTRLVYADPEPQRVLYFEGEPRWEYKFIRRAADDDHMVRLVSMLRTTENKIYRQGVENPQELASGFPAKAEDLFGFRALIIGSVDAGYFTPTQQRLIREFVDRRGGGLLLLGGRQSLSDGIWGGSEVADVLPVVLPEAHDTFHRDPATVSLAAAGEDSVICRLLDDPAQNIQQWKKLPYLMDYQDPGRPKPGAVVLAQMHVANRTMPLLVTESYGRGRTAVLATGGTWRWQMSLPLNDHSHDLFWQQLLRWLVTDARGSIAASVRNLTLYDEGHAHIAAEVRDKEFRPAADVRVSARIIGPAGVSATLDLDPVPNQPGQFQTDWVAPNTGVYVVELTAHRGSEDLGNDVATFERLDGVAESFHTEQNRSLLETLASGTGGRYVRAADLPGLAREIPYSSAGVTSQQLKDLWNMPAVFLLLLCLRCGEWLLRRRWGIV